MTSLRIVSLLPSATELICALGLEAHLVGRSHECDFPPSVRALPVCSRPRFNVSGSSAEIDRLVHESLASAASIYELDSELLQALRPTHILTQTLCEVCAVSLSDVEAALLPAALVPLSATSLEEVWDEIARVATTLGYPEHGLALAAELKRQIEDLSRKASGAERRPNVAVVEWLDPLMAAGNWIPELIAAAGAATSFGKKGEHSPYLDRITLENSHPDVVIVAPCGFDLARVRREMQTVAPFPGEVYLCDANQYLSRPGPRLVESLQVLCEILHPDRFPPTWQGTGWERYS